MVVQSAVRSQGLRTGGEVGRKIRSEGRTAVSECGVRSECRTGGPPALAQLRSGGRSCSFLRQSAAILPLRKPGASSPMPRKQKAAVSIRSCHTNPSREAASEQPQAPEPKPEPEPTPASSSRRAFLASAAVLLSAAAWQTTARSDTPATPSSRVSTPAERKRMRAEAEAAAAKAGPGPPGQESRVYDSSVLGEPTSLKGKEGVWKKLAASRVVYLGTTERVPVAEDQVRTGRMDVKGRGLLGPLSRLCAPGLMQCRGFENAGLFVSAPLSSAVSSLPSHLSILSKRSLSIDVQPPTCVES